MRGRREGKTCTCSVESLECLIGLCFSYYYYDLISVYLSRYQTERSTLSSLQLPESPFRLLSGGHLLCVQLEWQDNSGTKLCIDVMGGDEHHPFQQGVYFCQEGKSSNQVYSLSLHGEIRREEGCLEATDGRVMYNSHCHRGPNQLWDYSTVSRVLQDDHGMSCYNTVDGFYRRSLVKSCQTPNSSLSTRVGKMDFLDAR